MPQSTAQGHAAAGSHALLAFLMLLNVMNFVDRQLLASFANFIVPELGLSNTQFGLLTGLVFLVFYSVMGLFMGALADQLHRPRLIAGGVALWSVLTAASGAARGFVSLAVPRMFIGVGESILTPTSMSILADRFPAARMGFAAGVYYMGVPIGVGVSLLIAGYLGPAIGWRNCFYLLGFLGLALAAVMWFVPETKRRHASSATRDAPRLTFGQILARLLIALRTTPALALTIAGGVALHLVLGAASFDQLWYVHERGFERAWIAQTTGAIAVVAGVAGNLFGGIGGDWFLRRFGFGRATWLCLIMIVFAPFNIAYRIVPPDSAWFWVGVFAGYFQLGCFYGPTFSTVQELAPPEIRASVVAFYILMLNFIGLGVGVTAGGMMIDLLQARGVAEPYSITLLAFTLLSCLAIPLFWLAGRSFAAHREALAAGHPG